MPSRLIFPGERVVLVGNGPSVGDHPWGAFIDSHDVVVRFNHFELDPPRTGTRTHVWSVCHRRRPAGLDIQPERGLLIAARGRYVARAQGHAHARRIDVVETIPGAVYPFIAHLAGAPQMVPSTGLGAAVWARLVCCAREVNLVGFDAMNPNRPHHYFEDARRRFSHRPRLERRALRALVREGIATRWTEPPHR